MFQSQYFKVNRWYIGKQFSNIWVVKIMGNNLVDLGELLSKKNICIAEYHK